jgi:hypothetical protein
MTQVKEWSNQELNRKLAELMGYRVNQENCYFYQLVNGAGEPVVGWYAQNPDDAWNMVPDYYTDPAASLEVQAAAIEKDYKAYIHNLYTVVIYGESEDDGEYSAVSVEVAAEMLTASPRERTEAAYITMQQINGQ